MKWWRIVGPIVACCAGSKPVSAESGFLSKYSVASSCPDARWFEAELAVRARNPAALRQARLEVQVVAAGTKFVGRIRSAAKPQAGVRQLEHPRCGELLQALALVGTLIFETEERQRKSGEPTLAAPAAKPAEESGGEQSGGEQSGGEQSGAASKPHFEWRHGPSLGLSGIEAATPAFRPGPRIGYGVWLFPRTRGLVHSLQISAARVQSGTLAVGAYGNAELLWMSLRLEACSTSRFFQQAGLQGGGCAFLDFGELSGKGQASGASETITKSSRWVAPGAHLLLAWPIWDALFLTGRFGGFWPLTRPEYRFTERGSARTFSIHTVPNRPAVSLDFGMAVLFP